MQVPDGSAFCGRCGNKIGEPSVDNGAGNGATHSTRNRASKSLINKLNGYIGNANTVKLNWKDLFSAVPKRHTTEEAEDIFICGTSRTTPDIQNVSESWPKPWLYSRVFICFVITYVLLYLCCMFFQNFNAFLGLIIVGAFTVPFTTMVLFLELNTFRNISVYDVMKFFLVGGCASFVVTLLLFSFDIVNTYLSSILDAMKMGIIEDLFLFTTWGAVGDMIEEGGKLVIVYMLIKRRLSCHYILSALLVGACVGAGFAAFESAADAFFELVDYGIESMTSSIYLNGFFAPGGHVAWTAISGGAIIIAKGTGALTTDVFRKGRFWKIFSIPVVLHLLWDAPLFVDYFKYIALIVLVWVVVLILVNMGLDQVKNLKKSV